MRIQVEPVAPADYEAVGELTVRAYAPSGIGLDDPYYGFLRDTASRAGSGEVLVARLDGQVVGSVTWCPPGSDLVEVAAPGEGELRTLAVDPDHQGRGAGRSLVLACLDRARAAGCTGVALSSAEWMTVAHGLYESLGFVRVVERDWEPVPGIVLLAYWYPVG